MSVEVAREKLPTMLTVQTSRTRSTTHRTSVSFRKHWKRFRSRPEVSRQNSAERTQVLFARPAGPADQRSIQPLTSARMTLRSRETSSSEQLHKDTAMSSQHSAGRYRA